MTNDRAAFDAIDRVKERVDAYNDGHAAGYRTGYMDACWQTYADNIAASAARDEWARQPVSEPPVDRWHE